jgi:hypothetical protein
MRKYIFLIALCCSLAPAAAGAQQAIDCKSAKWRNVDMKTWVETCSARARAEQSASGRATTALAAATVIDSRVPVANVSFANVPTWSDADIAAYFASTRDRRYLTLPSNPNLPPTPYPTNPNFLRRISWTFPDDGCFARAEQVNQLVAQAGKVKPHKLFVFGGLIVDSEHSLDPVRWTYHVVPVVKNSAGQPIVFDAALSPCRPLPWKEWLLLMVDNLSQLSNIAGGWGVALGDANAYVPTSLVSGEPSHANDSLRDLREGGNDAPYLWWEWLRQGELGRDPNVVLGASPPWSGYACVNSLLEQAAVNVAAGSTQTASVTCPFGTLAVGGGIGAPRGFQVTRNSKTSGNGWQVTARNSTSSTAPLTARAVCLVGAPSGASVTTVTGSTSTVLPNATGTSSASCAAGTLVGGGYSTSGTTSFMRVYNNRRSTSTGSTWQVSARNTTASSRTVTAYAYCLANTRFTFSQVSSSFQGGPAFTSCSPRKVMGGGFTFSSASNYHVELMYNFGSEIYIVEMLPSPPSGDPALGYAECLAHP